MEFHDRRQPRETEDFGSVGRGRSAMSKHLHEDHGIPDGQDKTVDLAWLKHLHNEDHRVDDDNDHHHA